MRSLLVGSVLLWAGCGTEELVDGTFTAAEWEFVQTFRLDRQLPLACSDAACSAAASLGRELFFDPRISGPIMVAVDPSSGGLGAVGERGKVSCASCHDPARWFIDTRSQPNASSLGTGWTKRNVPGLVNAVYLDSYTWNGKYARIGDVLELALTSPAAMNTTKSEFVSSLRVNYAQFNNSPLTDDQVWASAVEAVGRYESLLVAGPSPFDRYAAGEDGATLTDSARRGLQVFIGRGLCSECHAGPMFSDRQFHNTGVEQRGEHAASIDHGRADITSDVADDGAFRTPTLRHVAKTAPYMHAGQLADLAEVIDFYRWGGNPTGFAGTRDPRILPLEIDDQDAADLVAFLETLTGDPVDASLTVP